MASIRAMVDALGAEDKVVLEYGNAAPAPQGFVLPTFYLIDIQGAYPDRLDAISDALSDLLKQERKKRRCTSKTPLVIAGDTFVVWRGGRLPSAVNHSGQNAYIAGAVEKIGSEPGCSVVWKGDHADQLPDFVLHIARRGTVPQEDHSLRLNAIVKGLRQVEAGEPVAEYEATQTVGGRRFYKRRVGAGRSGSHVGAGRSGSRVGAGRSGSRVGAGRSGSRVGAGRSGSRSSKGRRRR